MIADRDSELLALFVMVETDRQALADIVNSRAFRFPLVVIESFDQVHSRETKIAQHCFPRACRHSSRWVHQKLPAPGKFDQGLHAINQTFGEWVHRFPTELYAPAV